MRSARLITCRRPMAILSSGTNALPTGYVAAQTALRWDPNRTVSKPNIDRAQQLMRESGYDGRPVVLIGGSDIPAYQRLSLVTVDLLQKIGFKVDLQLSDWGSVATRRQKDPPAQGG
jgi:ABC-type transport system substrate-binding protein